MSVVLSIPHEPLLAIVGLVLLLSQLHVCLVDLQAPWHISSMRGDRSMNGDVVPRDLIEDEEIQRLSMKRFRV